MTPNLVERELTVNVMNPETGRNYHPIRRATVKRMVIDQEYGPHRREQQQMERQRKLKQWQALSPQRQLEILDNGLGKGVGAKKQRARIAKKIEELNKKKK